MTIIHEQQEILLRQLEHVLHEEINAYTLVEDRLMAKKLVLVQGKLEQLSKVDQELLTLTQKTVELESSRQYLMHSLGASHMTMLQLIQTLPSNKARPFVQARQRLTLLLRNVAMLSQENQSLLNISLKWISGAVETIAKIIAPEGASYGATGELSGQQSTLPGTGISSTVEHSV